MVNAFKTPIMHNLKYHVRAWAIFVFMACSWAIFSDTKQPMLPVTYNVVSLIIVFYSVLWMARKYWRKIEQDTAMYINQHGRLNTDYPHYSRYWQQPAFWGVVGIVLAYIGISWLVDGFWVRTGHLKTRISDFYYYSFARWSAESLVVCGGNVMAAIEYHFRKQKERERKYAEGCEELAAWRKKYEEELQGKVDDIVAYSKKMARRNNNPGASNGSLHHDN